MEEIKTYKEFKLSVNARYKTRALARKAIIAARSNFSRISVSRNWIRQVYYHHVFDDERKGFSKQLKYMRNFGEFISLDQVTDLISRKEKLDGRYFSVSFDDGFKNTYTNMMEITASMNVPIIIYIPTDFIGSNPENESDRALQEQFIHNSPKYISFLNWDECKQMLNHKISFGSHTASHTVLSKLNHAEIELELITSKQIIEEKLGSSCDHFASPRGVIGRDFDPVQTEKIARKTAYKTVAANKRGETRPGDNLYLLNRDHLVANWEKYQLKYFLGK